MWVMLCSITQACLTVYVQTQVAIFLLHVQKHDHRFLKRKKVDKTHTKNNDLLQKSEHSVPHITVIETAFSFCIVKARRKPFLFGFSGIDFCACVCLHSAHLQVLTPPETVQKVLDSFSTLNTFLL